MTCARIGCPDDARPRAIIHHSRTRVSQKRMRRRVFRDSGMFAVRAKSRSLAPLGMTASTVLVASGHERLEPFLDLGGGPRLAVIQARQDVGHDALGLFLGVVAQVAVENMVAAQGVVDFAVF